jgi:hypothetical protein
MTLSATRWSTPAGRGIDAPAFGVAAGLAPRAQLSFAVPYSRVSVSDDELSGGMGDVYAGLKLLLASSRTGTAGVSFSPTLEIISRASDGMGRTHLVLPLSVEAGNGRTRFYGSGGYFTRGAVFASGALERHVSDRVAVTGSLLQSWSTADPVASEAFGLRRTRTDLAGSVTGFLSSSAAVFASLSRTISSMEFDSSRYVVTGGLAFVLTPPARIPVRPPR